MEFKGTKGKWEVDKSGYITTNGGLCIMVGNDCISVVGDGNPHQPIKANALLISKAPEMLEMLQLWCMDMEERGHAYGDCYTMTKQLIKEATEIN